MPRLSAVLLLSLAAICGCASGSAESELRVERDRYALELADVQKGQRDSQATIERLRNDLQALQSQLGEARAKLEEGKKQLDAVNTAMTEKDRQLSEAASLRSQVDSLKAEKVSLERQLRDTEARLVDALDRARAAENQLQALRGGATRPATQPTIDMNK